MAQRRRPFGCAFLSAPTTTASVWAPVRSALVYAAFYSILFAFDSTEDVTAGQMLVSASSRSTAATGSFDTPAAPSPPLDQRGGDTRAFRKALPP